MSSFSPFKKSSKKKVTIEEEDSVEVESESQQPSAIIDDDIKRPIGLENALSPPFGFIVSCFNKLEGKQKHTGQKGEVIAAFISKWREKVGPDLYPAMRLLTPDRDTRRRIYQLKEQKLAKAYVMALGIPSTSEDATVLTSWKTPTRNISGAGDFSTIAYNVISSRSTYILEDGEKTVDDVNNVLDQLANAKDNVGADGIKRTLVQEHARILRECFETMTPNEQKWLIRIILKDLKIGMGEKTIFKALHPDAIDLFNTCSDMLRVCWKLYDVNYRLPREDNQVAVNSVFRPMLSSRNKRNIPSIVTNMKEGRESVKPFCGSEEDRASYYAPNEFMIEEKIDGERIQLHKDGDNYRWYSRKAKDYTSLYGKNPQEGSVTPFIHGLFIGNLEQVILDGEMLAYDPELKKYVAFGTLKTFAKKRDFSPYDTRPVFKVFDLLYYKVAKSTSHLMLDIPLRIRKKLLPMIINPQVGILEIVEVFRANSARDINQRLKVILEEFGEGLVIKHPESLYRLGGRENTWVKVKPDYMDELGETIDALVVGGFYGTGHKGGRHSSFLVALRDDSVKPINGIPFYHTFAKVGTGIDAEGYDYITSSFVGKWKDVKTKQNKKVLPDWLHTRTEIPDQIIEPSESFVIRIKAAEIIDADNYGADMTLRFPRACGIRKDIYWDKSFSLQEVRNLRGAGNTRSFGEALDGKHKKTKVSEFQSHTLNVPIGEVDNVSNIFAGLIFYVHRVSPDEDAKTALRVQIKANGGKFTSKMPKPSDERRIIDSRYVGLADFKDADTFDVLKPDWVRDCCTAGKLIPRTKDYYLKATEATSKTLEYNQPKPIITSPEDDKMDEDEEEEGDEASGSNNSPNKIIRRPEHDKDEEMGEEYDEKGGDSEEEEEKLNYFGIPRGEVDNSDDEDSGEETREESDAETSGPLASTSTSTYQDRQLVNNAVTRVQQLVIAPQEVQKFSLDDSDEEKEDFAAAPGMGAGGRAIDFNPDLLFDQYVAYFDTRENAVRNNLVESTANESTQSLADELLDDARKEFLENGGKVTDRLDDPSLTHILVVTMVPDRLKDLVNLTSSPRNRRIVTYNWVENSVVLKELQEVTDYAP